MILKFKTGRGSRKLMDYMSKGAGQDVPLFTNMAGRTPRALAREIAALRSLRPNLAKSAGHLILASDPSQRELTEAEWKVSLDLALAEHGAQNAPYAAWLHHDGAGPHLHVFLLRIRPDGSVISDSNSYRKNERAARAIEAHLGLAAPTPRAPEGRHPRADGACAERGRRRFERLAASITTSEQPPQKGKLKVINPSLIYQSVDESNDLDELKTLLAARNIECQFTQAPGVTEPTGWSLRQAGPAGTWLKGSQIDRDLSLIKVRERMKERARQRQVAAENRKEQLMELMDELDARADQLDAEASENHRVYLAQRQKGLAQLIGGLAVHSVRLAIGVLVNGLAVLIERLLGLPPGSLGRIQVPEFKTTTEVPVGVVPPASPRPGAGEAERKRLAMGQRLMSKVIDQTSEGIEQGKPELLPGLGLMKSPEIQAARAEVFKAIEASREGGDDDQDDEPYERERPR